VRPENLETDAGLEALRNGAFGDFVVAFSGDGEGSGTDCHIQHTGMITDEFVHSGTNTSRVQMDARRGDDRNDRVLDYYEALHRARQAAEFGAAAVLAAEGAEDADVLVAELMSLAGFAYTFFGEAFCPGVPFSDLVEGSIEFGEQKTTAETFAIAVERFGTAITSASAAGNSEIENLARVGAGRAQLDLGRFTEAAQVVASVPTDFVYEIKYSTNTPRQANGIYGIINDEERISVVNNEGINGIAYLDAYTAGDPRTPWEKDPRNGVGFDSSVEMFLQLKYTDRGSPIQLASGIEARLIEAEAALQDGDLASFELIHNAIRATIGLGPISTGGLSQAEIVDMHFEERALWFWLTGHRLGDMRRLVRQYDRDPESVFPTGAYFKPQFTEYGTATSLIIPFQEANNPNYSGCLP
jgi:hypothetical protein